MIIDGRMRIYCIHTYDGSITVHAFYPVNVYCLVSCEHLYYTRERLHAEMLIYKMVDESKALNSGCFR